MSGLERLPGKQARAIVALLAHPTIEAAAANIKVGESTLRRWLHLPAFRAAYRRARREVVENAIGRIQASTGQAVYTLLSIARDGAKDADRVRAARALLDHALSGLTDADVLHGAPDAGDLSALDTGDVVRLLAGRLHQLDRADLPTVEKARLTAAVADALLRAIGVDVLDKRLSALQAVLVGRKDNGR
jgi:hypothetical protein